ncbi:hypothetical protein MANES_14G022000v8 [Manihot esculenta]|uniref:HMA domain-containing protein n=1 Tax=Manihot esculenta TaxID=3983 RepID=A0A2C9UJ26_MANES|nr:hypothetical protein MANES_14G022000v8 [Manihot esculenta]
MKKLVLALQFHDENDRKKAMRAVCGLPGINSISADLNGKKMTVIGDVDPVVIVKKLRKRHCTKIISFG